MKKMYSRKSHWLFAILISLVTISIGCQKLLDKNSDNSDIIKSNLAIKVTSWLNEQQNSYQEASEFIDTIKKESLLTQLIIVPLNEKSNIVYVPFKYNTKKTGLVFISDRSTNEIKLGFISELTYKNKTDYFNKDQSNSPANILAGFYQNRLNQFSGSISAFEISNKFLWEKGYDQGEYKYTKQIMKFPGEALSEKKSVKTNSTTSTLGKSNNSCTVFYEVTFWSDGSVDRDYMGITCDDFDSGCEQTKTMSKDSTINIKTNCIGVGNGGGSPYLQFPAGSDYESKYPKLAKLIKNLYAACLSKPKTLECLKSYSNMSDDQIATLLQYGTGPKIYVADINVAPYSGPYRSGYFNAKNPNIITLDSKLIQDYENGVGFSDASFAFFISLVLLHEANHYGNNLNNFPEGSYEYGDGWETCMYGTHIDDIRAATIYLQKKQ